MSPGAPGSPIDEMTKKCPMCAERIKLEALVCRYCGHQFDQEAVRREVQTVEAELAKLPGAAPRWCLVVDQVPPERRAALLAILREADPSGTQQETGPTLDGQDVTIARGLALAGCVVAGRRCAGARRAPAARLGLARAGAYHCLKCRATT